MAEHKQVGDLFWVIFIYGKWPVGSSTCQVSTLDPGSVGLPLKRLGNETIRPGQHDMMKVVLHSLCVTRRKLQRSLAMRS